MRDVPFELVAWWRDGEAIAPDHGRLVALSAERELTAGDVHILERAATVAALAITKTQAGLPST